jgi:hypothetical protein
MPRCDWRCFVVMNFEIGDNDYSSFEELTPPPTDTMIISV